MEYNTFGVVKMKVLEAQIKMVLKKKKIQVFKNENSDINI